MMEELLLLLMTKLEVIGEQHEELSDTEVRQAMGRTIFRGFLRPVDGFEVTDDYLDSPAANQAIRVALTDYIDSARDLAPKLGLTTFHQRLGAFQNSSVVTESGGTFDEFFGAYSASLYGPDGEWLGDRS